MLPSPWVLSPTLVTDNLNFNGPGVKHKANGGGEDVGLNGTLTSTKEDKQWT